MVLHPFRSPALASLCDKVLYWPPPIDDGHGDKQWLEPYQCWGRFIGASRLREEGAEEMELAYGSVIVDFFYIGSLPLLGGYVWRGCASTLKNLVPPPLEGDDHEVARQIIQVRSAQPMRDRLMSLAILKIR